MTRIRSRYRDQISVISRFISFSHFKEFFIFSNIDPESTILFSNIAQEDLAHLLKCLQAKYRSYTKGEFILHEGDLVHSIGFITNGTVQIIKNDYDGNRTIQAILSAGSIFAESFVCAGLNQSPVSVIAAEDSTIVHIPFSLIIQPCKSVCHFHNQLIQNMVMLLAKKNLFLNSKIELAGKRTIREKLLLYLSTEKKKTNTKIFEIPFNRNELADFLSVDRSALSRELSKMKSEGLLDYHRNFFNLKK